MAKKVKKVSVAQKQNPISTQKKQNADWNFPLSKQNFLILGLGVLTILLGYAVMYFAGSGDEYALPDGNWNSTAAIVIGPFLLVLGYCVVIPYGIYKFFGSTASSTES
jgi:hypothetical protein